MCKGHWYDLFDEIGKRIKCEYIVELFIIMSTGLYGLANAAKNRGLLGATKSSGWGDRDPNAELGKGKPKAHGKPYTSAVSEAIKNDLVESNIKTLSTIITGEDKEAKIRVLSIQPVENLNLMASNLNSKTGERRTTFIEHFNDDLNNYMTAINAGTAPGTPEGSPRGGRRTKRRRHKKRSTQKKTKGRRRKSRRNR